MMMRIGSGTAVYIERNTEFFERFFNQVVITIHHILRRASFFAGTNGDGHSVFVASADKQHLLTFQTKVSYINVGRHIHAGQVSDMHRTISIRQGGSYRCSFKILVHISCILLFVLT